MGNIYTLEYYSAVRKDKMLLFCSSVESTGKEHAKGTERGR